MGRASWIFTHDAANADYLHSKHSFCEKHFNYRSSLLSWSLEALDD